jgi:signal transduction histidine kinase
MDFRFTGDCEPALMDQSLVFEIVTNLLSNAVKYSPDGGTIHFHVWCSQDTAFLKIQDQGIGIPEEDQKYVFESFHRASNVDTIRGAGLGLSIVRHAVNLHGGTIQLESVEGAGSTFTIALPLQPAPHDT